MNQGQSRILCPKCRSNNFLGQTNCWQCGASLPPPETFTAPVYSPPQKQPAPQPYSRHPNDRAFQPPQPQYPPQPQVAYAPQESSRARWAVLYYGVFGVVLLMLLVYVGFYGKMRRDAMVIDRGSQAIQDANERIMQGLNRASTQTHQPEPGSVEDQAQREIKRLYQQSGVAPPPTDPNGQVHLQGGGSISRQQWEKAKQSLQGGL